MAEDDFGERSGADLYVPKRAIDCDRIRPSVDFSWQESTTGAVEALLARPPTAQWRVVLVGNELRVEPIRCATVRISTEPDRNGDKMWHARLKVIEVYVREQQDFVRTGDISRLKRFAPQREEYGAHFGAGVEPTVKNHSPTELLRGQFLYLPSGDLCAASILHVVNPEAEIRAFETVREKERKQFADGKSGYSQEFFAELISEEIGYTFTEDEFRRLSKELNVPSSTHDRREQYAQERAG